jgi:hypothetical protein
MPQPHEKKYKGLGEQAEIAKIDVRTAANRRFMRLNSANENSTSRRQQPKQRTGGHPKVTAGS